MKGEYSNTGIMSVSWDINCEKLLSPDGTQHLVTCGECGKPLWKDLNVIAVICNLCYTDKLGKGENYEGGDLDISTVGEIK